MTINVNCPPRGLFIGHETENVARTLDVDFSAWAAEHGPGTLQVLIQRPGDSAPYPVTITVEGTVATWKPSETDLAEAGTGAVQLVYTTAAGVREKTQIIPVMVEPSLGVESDPPEGWTSWLDQLTDLAAETEQHAASAAESAGNAADSAAGALQSATDAGSAKNAAVAAAEAAAASVSHYPQIVGGVWYVWSPTAGEYISTGIDAQGEDGVSPTVEITAIQGGHRVVITDADGPHTFDVLDGVTPDMSAYRTAADQDEIDDAQDEQIDDLKSAIEDLEALTNRKAGMLVDTASGAIATFVPDSTIPDLLGVSVDIEPVQAGSGDPSPDNVRPISGWDSVEVEATGINVWDAQWEGGYYDISDGSAKASSSWQRSKKDIVCKPNTAYCARQEAARASLGYFLFYKEDGEYISSLAMTGNVPTIGQTFSTPSECRIIRIYRAVQNDGLGFSINYPATDNAYHPYAGNRYVIALGQTVYGGTLTIAEDGSVKALVDRAMVRVADSSVVTGSVSVAGTHRYNISVAGIKRVADATVLGNLICSSYPNVTALATYRVTLGASVSHNSDSIYIYDPEFATATVEEFKTAKGDVQLVYELATPIVIDLDPVTIATIAGQTNNVWADAGDVDVTFAADLKHYIDSKIAAAVAALS